MFKYNNNHHHNKNSNNTCMFSCLAFILTLLQLLSF
uniref:Uncharacterized protein n=1 Tax=Anguilla anguilla TaxID=7936 RepID=A0A0E9WM79_ANGAN